MMFNNLILQPQVKSLITSLTLCLIVSSLYAKPIHQWTALSDRGYFTVHMEPEGDYNIGDFHHWIVTVMNHDAKPVTNAQLTIGGGMDVHGHGLPSQPQVSKYLGQGRYLVEGMLFNMAGEWNLLVSVKHEEKVDTARLDLLLHF